MLDVFVAMGGDDSGVGTIDANKLVKVIKDEFNMTIDIEKLVIIYFAPNIYRNVYV